MKLKHSIVFLLLDVYLSPSTTLHPSTYDPRPSTPQLTKFTINIFSWKVSPQWFLIAQPSADISIVPAEVYCGFWAEVISSLFHTHGGSSIFLWNTNRLYQPTKDCGLRRGHFTHRLPGYITLFHSFFFKYKFRIKVVTMVPIFYDTLTICTWYSHTYAKSTYPKTDLR